MILNANSYREFLLEELARRQQVNPRYSQRAFARHMGLSAGELSELLRGRRALSLKSALKVARALELNPTETKHLVHLAHVEKSLRSGADDTLISQNRSDRGEQIAFDTFHIISDWYCMAILNLADCTGFSWNPNWIAKRLAITVAQVQSALERLERVGLVNQEYGRRWINKDHIYTAGGTPSEAVRTYHRSMLKKAADSLDFQKVSDRDVSGIGFAVDPKHLPSMQRDIEEFQEQILAKYSKGKKTEVYQLQIALFRLTEGEKNEI